MTEIRDQEKIRDKGVKARQILHDPDVIEAFEDIEKTLIHNLKTSAWNATDEREEIARQLKTMEAFKKQFDKRISDGKVAESRIDQLINKVRRFT